MDISVVLPIHNERENLVPLIDEIAEVLGPTGKTFEIIAVDDGSKDDSPEILRRLAAERPYVRALLFRRNAGQSAAFDAGFHAASGDLVVTMDADRQNDPRDIPRMIDKLNEGYDMVTGWRKNRKDGVLLRKVPSRIANAMIRKVTGAKIHDLGCSLKVYRKELTDEMRLWGEMHRFISVLAEGLGGRVGEVVVNHRPRVAGKSKYGLMRTVKVMLDMTTIWFMRRYQTKPIYVFGGLGLLMLFIAATISAFVGYEKLRYGIWVHRNPLFLIAVTSALMGVQSIGTGILAELIVRSHFESQRKSAYGIGTRVGFPARGSGG
jgi:glycosyltransferase involved in cell wall biosynthesis